MLLPPLHRRRRKSQTASVLVPISPPSGGEGEQACLLAERWRWMLLRAILLSFAGVVRLNAIPCQLATSFFLTITVKVEGRYEEEEETLAQF